MKQKNLYKVSPLSHLSQEDTLRHMSARNLSNKKLTDMIREELVMERAQKKTNKILDGFNSGAKLSEKQFFELNMFNKVVKQ